MNIDEERASRARPWDEKHDYDLIPLVAALYEHPGDKGFLSVLADLMDENGPTPVCQHELPTWFRPLWVKHVPKMDSERSFVRCAGPRRDRDVAQEIRVILGDTVWDHWGLTVIGPWPCLVTEPYADVERVAEALAKLPPLYRVAWGYAREGWHQRHTVRGTLFPPLHVRPSKTDKRRLADGCR